MTSVKARGGVRVTRSGAVLPFSAPVIPWWLAVPLMFLTVVIVSGVAVLAVVS